MPYAITFRRQAAKDLLKLQRSQPAKAADIRDALTRVATAPAARNNNLRPLRNAPGAFRLRVGDWRVSYTLDHAAQVIDVFEIAPKGAAYR